MTSKDIDNQLIYGTGQAVVTSIRLQKWLKETEITDFKVSVMENNLYLITKL